MFYKLDIKEIKETCLLTCDLNRGSVVLNVKWNIVQKRLCTITTLPKINSIMGLYVTISAIIVLTLANCEAAPAGEQTRHGTANERVLQVADASNRLGIDVYKQLVSTNDPIENTFLSPFSMSVALGMAYLGARGDSAQEMRTGMKFAEVNLEDHDVHPAFQDLLEHLAQSSSTGNRTNYEMKLANAALVQSGLRISDAYKTGLMEHYKATMEQVNFQTDGLVVKDKVNEWVSNKTNGKIQQLLADPLSPSTALLLLNAVYFKGTWKTKFDPSNTRERVFYNNGQISTVVPTMRLVNKGMKYSSSDDLESELLEMPYIGEDVSMVIILPRRGTGSLRNLNENLTVDKLQQALEGLRVQERITFYVDLPKFKLEPEVYKLKGALQDLGMNNIFSDLADFSGITNNQILKIKEVFHKAVVEVNEEGSEAAATTVVQVFTKSGNAPPFSPIYFQVNRPFMFLIRQRSTGLILFMGCVNEL